MEAGVCNKILRYFEGLDAGHPLSSKISIHLINAEQFSFLNEPTLQAVDEVHCLSYTLHALSARILILPIGIFSGIRFRSLP